MNSFFYRRHCLLLCLLAFAGNAGFGHPTGSIVALPGSTLWSYVSPIGDPDHHACVMTWDEEDGVQTWLVSSHTGSDWMISPTGEDQVYLIERRYDPANGGHRYRLLKSTVGGSPVELWQWSEDTHRIGEGGFIMLSDDEMMFARYPYVYRMSKSSPPEVWDKITGPVLALRSSREGFMVLRSEDAVSVITESGDVLREWSGILDTIPDHELPFGGNRIFDSDVSGSELWTAYWGARRFDRRENGDSVSNETVLQLESPWLPHGVALSRQGVFLLASSLEPGFEITPRLWHWYEGKLRLIWSGETGVFDENIIANPD